MKSFLKRMDTRRRWEAVILSFTFFFSPYFPLFHTHSLDCPLSVFFSISRCTPTCSYIDCYARRIAPYTLTLCCKSFIENIEVFLREACIISEFGCSLCSCLGTRPVQFHCCFAVALCFGRIQGRRLAGGIIVQIQNNMQDWKREGFLLNQHSPVLVLSVHWAPDVPTAELT